MSSTRLLALAAALLAAAPATALAQSLSPTLPSDTLQANYAPRSAPGPTPELAPTLPSDTLKLHEPGEWQEQGEWREPEQWKGEGQESRDEGTMWDEEWVEPVRVTSRISAMGEGPSVESHR
jgi:hypothetical protein